MSAPTPAAPPPVLQTSPQRWSLAALLFGGTFLCYVHRGALAAATPFLLSELDVSRSVMGTVLSAFFWGYALMQMPSGWLVDRWGTRRVYALSMALAAVAASLSGLAVGVVTLLVTRLVLGIAQAPAFPASSRAVADHFVPAERATASAVYLGGVRFGQAAALYAGGLLIPIVGWKPFLIASGLVALAWVAPWSSFLARWERRPDRAVAGSSPSFGASLALLRHRSLTGIFIGFFAFNYAWNVFANWLPTYLKQERGFSNQEVALYGSTPFVLMAGVILCSGLLSDRLVRGGRPETATRKRFVAVGLLIATAAVPAALVPDRYVSLGLLLVSLTGLGIASPNTWTLTQSVCDRRIVGAAAGIQNFGGNLGAALAPALTGWATDLSGSFTLAWVVSGAILVAGLASYLGLVGRRVLAE